MANVNLKTGEIFGCKKGTKTHYHEVGHLEFEKKNRFGNFTRTMQDFSVRTLLITCVFNIVLPHYLWKYVSVFLLLAYIFSEIYEELWCWKYANQQLKLAVKKEDDNSESTGTKVSSV